MNKMNAETEQEHLSYNALRNAEVSHYGELKRIKSRFGSWEEAWKKFPRMKSSLDDPESEWEQLERAGVRLMLADDSDFPPLLREIPLPPFGIYVKGNLPDPTQPAIAIVGTRKATEDGVETARRLGAELARAGAVIVSGLAFGIDAAAHTGCLDADGRTVAVLGNGLDAVYPKSNERLARRILEQGGALVSEYPLGTPSLPHHFLERNRLISGLSLGIVVIEAPKASGSLATARFALEQNRDVFVVPGPARHQNFHGSHELIRSGARLVTSATEVLEDLNLVEPDPDTPAKNFGSEEEKIIFEVIGKAREPLEIDKIIEITHLESRIANQALTMLLLKNIVQEKGEGYVIGNS